MGVQPAREYRWASATSPCEERADSGSTLSGSRRGHRRRRPPVRTEIPNRPRRMDSGASSIRTWALVPVNPKALTPARRGLPLVMPGRGFVHHLHRQRCPTGYAVRGCRKCRVWGSRLFCSDSTTLTRPADTGRRLQSARHWSSRVPISSGRPGSPGERRAGRGRLHLDRVAERGARAVRFEVVDIVAGQPGPGQCRTDESLLGTTIGHGQTAGGAVLVDRAAADDRADPITVALRVGRAA